jgi:hypothetical protein
MQLSFSIPCRTKGDLFQGMNQRATRHALQATLYDNSAFLIDLFFLIFSETLLLVCLVETAVL